jgi:hypothetical protein
MKKVEGADSAMQSIPFVSQFERTTSILSCAPYYSILFYLLFLKRCQVTFFGPLESLFLNPLCVQNLERKYIYVKKARAVHYNL